MNFTSKMGRFVRKNKILTNYELYLFVLPVVVYLAIFKYYPMYGVQLAFKDFIVKKGITGSPFIGFDHFSRFFNSYVFWDLIKNTLGISFYQIIVGFPLPIILAIMLNYQTRTKFKKTVQTITYAPHFVSTVVVVGMLKIFLSPTSGFVNHILGLVGIEPIMFMGKPEWFKTIYVLSGVWQTTGWGTIIYLAALSSIDPSLHEAAIVDGASKLKRIIHIDLPSIMPTAIILLILRTGSIMNVGFEKVFLMQNSMNIGASEIISTYVYKRGLINAEYGYSTAIGLFNSITNFILIMSVNAISRKVGETSLW